MRAPTAEEQAEIESQVKAAFGVVDEPVSSKGDALDTLRRIQLSNPPREVGYTPTSTKKMRKLKKRQPQNRKSGRRQR